MTYLTPLYRYPPLTEMGPRVGPRGPYARQNQQRGAAPSGRVCTARSPNGNRLEIVRLERYPPIDSGL